MCTIFAVYDMCRNDKKKYPKFYEKIEQGKEEGLRPVQGRGEGEDIDLGESYW